jgi:hypothetical protein
MSSFRFGSPPPSKVPRPRSIALRRAPVSHRRRNARSSRRAAPSSRAVGIAVDALHDCRARQTRPSTAPSPDPAILSLSSSVSDSARRTPTHGLGMSSISVSPHATAPAALRVRPGQGSSAAMTEEEAPGRARCRRGQGRDDRRPKQQPTVGLGSDFLPYSPPRSPRTLCRLTNRARAARFSRRLVGSRPTSQN